MASLQASLLFSSPPSSSSRRKCHALCHSPQIKSVLHVPSLGKQLPNLNFKQQVELLNIITSDGLKNKKNTISFENENNKNSLAKIYAILEAISDRMEMHKNIGEQRQNWNNLLLNSINMVTLTAALMAGLAGLIDVGGAAILSLKLSSILLFSFVTGILVVMNKIQPSQLVEEQRNAVRLLKQLETRIRTGLAIGHPSEEDAKEAMESVLAIDKAYPLPLLGAMLEKFPKTFEPASWWPSNKPSKTQKNLHRLGEKINGLGGKNGWSEDLEEELREIVEVTKKKDLKEYVRLGNKALNMNKVPAIFGPLLTGAAAIGSTFLGQGAPWAVVVVPLAGSLAAIVNTIEHGGQVGMVFEMYRNSAGFFNLLEETIEFALEEEELGRRENGEVFEMKMALSLGRSLSQLKNLADGSRRSNGDRSCVDEFACKLF
ncbi:hypothetical protein Ancab_033451 [Ancistrocladus abbreviatus]